MAKAPDFGQSDLPFGKPEARHSEPLSTNPPGYPPFLRGPYPSMYREHPWTVRQYAGFSTAEESNAFYRTALAQGQRGLSVAFDLPTHRGYDSDHPRAENDVGMAGVAIDSILDMRELFDGIPLDSMSVSMTMNGAVIPIMALFIANAEEHGTSRKALSGTIQNDILKEFMVRNTYIYPPGPSLRIVGDIIAYTAREMPRFNSISVSGYHMQEAGAPPDLELGYTLADGLEYVRTGLRSGLSIDDFAPRISFFFGIGMSYFMEVAKLRAARFLWAHLIKNFSPKDPRSLMLRTHCQTSGWSLAAQDARNNIIRTLIEAMAAVHGHTQSLHTNALDEALALPSDDAAAIARDTQKFLMGPAGSCLSIDPWGGSEVVESMTRDLAHRSMAYLREIEDAGGMAKALESGLPKERIEAAAARTQAEIDAGTRVIVGVNAFLPPDPVPVPLRKISQGDVLQTQRSRLQRLKAERNPREVTEALANLRQAALQGDNLLECAVRAAHARATVGEMSLALEDVFGRFEATLHLGVGLYSSPDPQFVAMRTQLEQRIVAFEKRMGRRPRILVAKIGQDGHDRGQKVVASALADLGFDVDVGSLFQTPEEVARQAVENDVHIVGVSSLAAAHLKTIPELRHALSDLGRPDIQIALGGVIPDADHEALVNSGVVAIFGPGTPIMDAANRLLDGLAKLNDPSES
jgi:methylmalonyl-CoA mutase